MPEKEFFEDIREGEETETFSRTITETDILKFVAISGDYNPLNIDTEFAKENNFSEKVAPELLGLAISSGLRPQKEKNPLAILAFLGLSWDFKLPIKIGDTIKAKRIVKEKKETKDKKRGIIITKILIVNQKDEVIQEGKTTIMVARR